MNQDMFIKAPFVRRITKDLTLQEERLIEAAEIPLWQPITEEWLLETRAKLKQDRKVLIQGVCIALCVMGAGLLLGATKYATAVGITAVVFAIAAIVMHLRCKIDESAVMTEVPLHKITSSIIGNRAVCYLPDGRYELRVTGDNSYANTLIIVKYKSMTTWQAVFIRHPEDKPLPSTLGLDEENAPDAAALPEEEVSERDDAADE